MKRLLLFSSECLLSISLIFRCYFPNSNIIVGYLQSILQSDSLLFTITINKELIIATKFQNINIDLNLLNRFYTTNCVDFMCHLENNCIDLTLTSPPYDDIRNYNGYEFEFEKIAQQLFRITKTGGIVVWVVGDKINGGRTLTSFKQALYFQEIGFNMHDVMIYAKKNTPFMRSNAYTNAYEFMFILSKGRPKTFNPLKEKTVRSGYEKVVANKGADAQNNKVLKELKKEKTKTNIWYYAVGLGGSTNDREAFKHPAIFPEKLAEDHILSWSNEGDIVFDPMCGSGTTCKMAAINKRNFIGLDVSEEYIKVAEERLKRKMDMFYQL